MSMDTEMVRKEFLEAVGEYRKNRRGFLERIGLTEQEIIARETADQIAHLSDQGMHVAWCVGYYIVEYGVNRGRVLVIMPDRFMAEHGNAFMVPFGRDVKGSLGDLRLRFVEPLLGRYMKCKSRERKAQEKLRRASLRTSTEQATRDVVKPSQIEVLGDLEKLKEKLDETTSAEDRSVVENDTCEMPVYRDARMVVPKLLEYPERVLPVNENTLPALIMGEKEDKNKSNGDILSVKPFQEVAPKSLYVRNSPDISLSLRVAPFYDHEIVIEETSHGYFAGLGPNLDLAELNVRLMDKRVFSFNERPDDEHVAEGLKRYLADWKRTEILGRENSESLRDLICKTYEVLRKVGRAKLYDHYLRVRVDVGGLLQMDSSVVLPLLRSLFISTFSYYDLDMNWIDSLLAVYIARVPKVFQLTYSALRMLQKIWDDYDDLNGGYRCYRHHGRNRILCFACLKCQELVVTNCSCIASADHRGVDLSKYDGLPDVYFP